MRWPWTRKEPEKRQSTQPFTDAIVSAIAAQAGGNLTGDATAVGALEMASRCLFSRVFGLHRAGVRHGEKGVDSQHIGRHCAVVN